MLDSNIIMCAYFNILHGMYVYGGGKGKKTLIRKKQLIFKNKLKYKTDQLKTKPTAKYMDKAYLLLSGFIVVIKHSLQDQIIRNGQMI